MEDKKATGADQAAPAAPAESASLSQRAKGLPSQLPKWAKWALYAAIAAVAAFVGYKVYDLGHKIYEFLKNFNDAVDTLTAQYGINTWLAKAMALAFLTPLGLGIKHSFFTLRKEKTKIRIATAAYACLYFLAMYAVSRNAFFSHKTGEVLQWYAETPEGVRFFDSPGFDPKYGIKLKPATADLKAAQERRRLGQIPKPIELSSFPNLELFDPVTGSPQCWYYLTADGRYELFDSPGFHPRYQQPLSPITQQAAGAIHQWLQNKEAVETTKREKQAKEAKEGQAVARKAAQEQSRLEYIDRYVNRSIGRAAGVKQWTVLIVGRNGEPSSELAGVAREILTTKGLTVISLFRPQLVEDRLNEQLFMGDAALISKLDLSRVCDGMILGRLVFTDSKSEEMQGLVTARVSLDARIIATQSGQIQSEIRAEERGGGFSNAAAESQALERLSKVFKDRLDQAIR